jgi:hypothetical protein
MMAVMLVVMVVEVEEEADEAQREPKPYCRKVAFARLPNPIGTQHSRWPHMWSGEHSCRMAFVML